MLSMTYRVLIPRKFVLESGDVVILTEKDTEKLARATLFRLWVPDIDSIYNYLVEARGFKTAVPAVPKGEKYSLRKTIDDTWELHLRLYSNGFIDAEVEVRREYIEHLTSGQRLNVVYEAYDSYKDIYDKLHLWYAPSRSWVTSIIDNFSVELQEPSRLIPWKPIVLGVVAGILVTYKLLKPRRR